MNWEEYENEIQAYFCEQYPNARIERNAKIVGRYSRVERQIDTLIEESAAGFKMRIVIDAKYYKKKIDVKDVESFLSMLIDVDANKGLMVSLNGYSTGAINRAHYDPTDLELDVFSLAELKEFQAHVAIPFSGQHGVVLTAPFGWIVDSTPREGAVACLYQKGFDLKKSQKAKEWMYINFWIKDEKVDSLDRLISHQEAYLKEVFPNAQFSYSDGPHREKERTIIRTMTERTYPTPEHIGFVEFDDFIFFCVLFSPMELSKKNLRKLEYILASVIPISIVRDDAT
jgi:hypothetical protein